MSGKKQFDLRFNDKLTISPPDSDGDVEIEMEHYDFGGRKRSACAHINKTQALQLRDWIL